MWVGRNSEAWGVLGLIGDTFANPPTAPTHRAPDLSFFAPKYTYMGASGGCIQWSTSMAQFGCGASPLPSPIDKMKSLFFEGVEGIMWLGFELCSPNFHHIRGGPMRTVGACGEYARVRACALRVRFPRGAAMRFAHLVGAGAVTSPNAHQMWI